MAASCNCLYGYGDPRCCVNRVRTENTRRTIAFEWPLIEIDDDVPDNESSPWEDREDDVQPERKP